MIKYKLKILVLILLLVYVIFNIYIYINLKNKEKFTNIYDIFLTDDKIDEIKNNRLENIFKINNDIKNDIEFSNNNVYDKYTYIFIDDEFSNSSKVFCNLINKNNIKYMFILGSIDDKIKIRNINNDVIGELKPKIYNTYLLNMNNNKYDVILSDNNTNISLDIDNINIFLKKENDYVNIYINSTKVGNIIENKLEILDIYKKYINFVAILYILLIKINYA